MPRFALYLLAGILFLGSVSGARAELVCQKPTVHLGDIKAGVPLRHRFTVTNQGTATVELIGFKTSCGCFRPELSKRILVAGESATVDLVGNTLTQPAGPQAWRIRLAYRESGEDRELTFEIQANLQVELALIPPTLTLTTEGPLTHEITLRDLRDKPLAVRGVETTAPGLQVRIGEPRRLEEKGWARTLTLTVTADYPPGRRDEMLVIRSQDPDYPELRLPLTIQKRSRGEVAVRPSLARFTGTPGEPFPAKLILLGEASSPVDLERVEVAHTAITCTFATTPGAPTTLKIRVDGSQVPKTGLESAVRVLRRSPNEPPLVIPVRVEWQQP